jgi:hypothetical protein
MPLVRSVGVRVVAERVGCAGGQKPAQGGPGVTIESIPFPRFAAARPPEHTGRLHPSQTSRRRRQSEGFLSSARRMMFPKVVSVATVN